MTNPTPTRPYVAPALTPLGSVEKLTLGNNGNGNSNNNGSVGVKVGQNLDGQGVPGKIPGN